MSWRARQKTAFDRAVDVVEVRNVTGFARFECGCRHAMKSLVPIGMTGCSHASIRAARMERAGELVWRGGTWRWR